MVEYFAIAVMANYFKSFLAGVVGALAGVLVWIIASIRFDDVTGSINLSDHAVEAAALVGFVVGSTWEFRRLHRRRSA